VAESVRRRAAHEFLRRLQPALSGHLRGAWLFGSVARGDDREDSDVDILLVLDERGPAMTKLVYTIAEEVSVEMDVDLSLKVFDEREYASMHATRLLRHVQAEGIALG
jgi:predicted nucleotidyltransferase